MEKYKAILFDFDDTLGDRETYAYLTYKRILQEKAPDLDDFTREAILQDCMIYDQLGNVKKTYVSEKIKKVYGIDFGEDFDDWWQIHQWEDTVLFDGASETVAELKRRGYRLGIITNGHPYGQAKKVELSGLSTYFDTVIVSGDTPYTKPDKEIFELAAANLGVKPQECVFVGDTFGKDILGAYKAGMKPVWIFTHGHRTCEINILKIRDIRALLDYFL